MFSQVSVILFTGERVWQTPPDRHPPPTGRHHPWADTPWADIPPGQTRQPPGRHRPGQTLPGRQPLPPGHTPPRPWQTTTAADGTHPTYMAKLLTLKPSGS